MRRAVAPILPGLSDAPEQLEAVTRVQRRRRGVDHRVMLHLRPGVKEVFLAHLAQTHPHLVDHYRRLYGSRTHLPARFGVRMGSQAAILNARTRESAEVVVEAGQVELHLAGLAADVEEPLHARDRIRVEQRTREPPLLSTEAGDRIR